MLQLQLPTHSGAFGASIRTFPQWHEPVTAIPGGRPLRRHRDAAVVNNAVLVRRVADLPGPRARVVRDVDHLAAEAFALGDGKRRDAALRPTIGARIVGQAADRYGR